MSGDRVTLNEPGDWLGPSYALGLVDEVVARDALVHFEMTNDAGAYMIVENEGLYAFLRIYARPTTRAERRDILAHSDEQLRDHLRTLLPRRWGRTWWSIPWWRRPWAAVRQWWEFRRQASAVLCVRLEEESGCGMVAESSVGNGERAQ